MGMLRTRRVWLGLLIGVLCLWLALRDVPFGELARAIANARFAWLFPALILILMSVLVRSWRWVVLLGKPARLADSFWAQGIGYLFTNVLPLRMGEPARIIVMSERCGQPILKVASSAVWERLLDVATVVLALILVLPGLQVPHVVIQTGLTFGAMIVPAFVILVLIVFFRERSEVFWLRVGRRISILPPEMILIRWKELVAGLSPMAHWPTAARAVGWSLVSWVCSIAMYWCVLRIFHPGGTFVEATFMVVALSFAVSLPSSPGFVGIFQLVGQQALVVPFGAKYDASSALAITLAAHLIYYMVTTALGVIGLWQFRASFANLGRTIMTMQASRKIT